MPERDRDRSGRPSNSRQRDELGRPLPHGVQGVPRIPDDLDLSPAAYLCYAQQLLDDGLAFNAHEVLEAAWKSAPDDERPLWQGLAQIAVGITHIQRGNLRGAATILRRAAGRIAEVGQVPHGIDAAGLIRHADALAADLDSGVEVAPGRLRPRLLRPRL
ncbi:MAG: DUF309 domain-containing protein [Mycolicibacterium sp.]|uniref:DUF309 domain-containing protein n=1 Tax=Mycolicibacterium sp. TaxID=2320850 RepID=UPI003D139117